MKISDVGYNIRVMGRMPKFSVRISCRLTPVSGQKLEEQLTKLIPDKLGRPPMGRLLSQLIMNAKPEIGRRRRERRGCLKNRNGSRRIENGRRWRRRGWNENEDLRRGSSRWRIWNGNDRGWADDGGYILGYAAETDYSKRSESRNPVFRASNLCEQPGHRPLERAGSRALRQTVLPASVSDLVVFVDRD